MLRKKKINKDYTLLFTPHFPYNTLPKSSNKRALLGIGGNMGDVVRRFEHLFWYLKRAAFIHVQETTPILKNPPFGYKEQDDFYNAVLFIETPLTPKRLLSYVLRIERLFGRKRSFKDAPRTLDIDILFYENVSMDTKQLTLPHPEWKNRSSVLIPLAYISPEKRRFFRKEMMRKGKIDD
ncbi:MAG: 2-amino-4-hydroxy-6-hydroxymethyldihydropteridine diphosphokinase [Sulfurovum sp.]|nr:MAG: 2-amino-4-hydroxy-6-hydroxymethyldihydropteridine diphosphokinase [Sulfurovum sp.]RUM72520.1 MAG: 2-amino-4-hydroxy-6-hydroxymethyldihydropteridine diphosphokinase [Sulfurovum sp.]RUM74063.1 MAG: 2-amino-4-hydroxy-6-hydroxymethyldihydropteridine diphosphokinase [Sulfurovum sp.]